MATKLRAEDYPEIRENWAEAVFEGRARCAVTIKSGHTLISDEAPGFAGEQVEPTQVPRRAGSWSPPLLPISR